MATSILRVTTTVQKGGAGAHVLALHNGINRTSHFQSSLLCPREMPRSTTRISYPFGRFTSALNFAKTRLLGLDSYFEPIWNHRFKNLISEFDIIHLHHLQGYFFDTRSLAHLCDKNVVLTLHDVWPLTGRCSILTDCDRWQSTCGRCPRKDIYPAVYPDLSRFLHRKKKEAFDALQHLRIVVPSRYAEGLLQASHLSDRPYAVVPPGIDCSVFRPSKAHSREKPVLGVVAAKPGEEQKGLEVVRQVIGFLSGRSHRPFEIHIVGALSRSDCRWLAQFPFVRHTQFVVDENALSRLYNQFDLFLSFSHQETFGKTVVEAQACGVPVLARKIPAFEENVLFGELISDVSPQHILHRAEVLLARDWDREKMHQAMTVYSIENMVQHYIKVYRSFDDE